MRNYFRKILSLTLCVAMLMLSFGQMGVVTAADSGDGSVTDGDFTYLPVFDSNGVLESYTITEFTDDTATEVTFPGEYNGKPVKVINRNAYVSKPNITSIVFSEGIEELDASGGSMFNINLETVKFPSTLKKITASRNSTRIEEVYIADIAAWCDVEILLDDNRVSPNMYSKTSKLYDADGNLIEHLIIPDGVETIKHGVFSGAASITSITVSDSVKLIEHGAFSGCLNIENINLPDVPIHIQTGAFNTSSPFFEKPENQDNGIFYIGNHLVGSVYGSDYQGEELIIREGTIDIADYSLYTSHSPGGERSDRNNFTKLYIPDSVKRIGDYAFYSGVFTELVWGAGVEYVGEYAFYLCENISELIFNEGLEYVGEYAFGECCAVTKLHIPSTFKNPNGEAFFYMPMLTEITCAQDSLYYAVVDNVLYSKDMTKVVLAANCMESYILPSSVVEIVGYSFINCETLSDIYLHNHIERIGVAAFEGTAIYKYAETSQYIGNYLLSSSAENLTVRSGTIGIAEGVFWLGNTIMKTVSLPSSLEFIEGDMSNIEEISIPTIEQWYSLRINNEEFVDSLKNVKLKIGGNNITKIEIPEGVKTLENYRLGDCSTLTHITIPASVARIEKDALYNCPSDLVVYGVYGTEAHRLATSNDYTAGIFEIFRRDLTSVDFTEKLIRTKLMGISNFRNIIDVHGDRYAIGSPGMTVNGVELYGTGSKLMVYWDTDNVSEYTLIMEGDTNGDGVCDVLDATQTAMASSGKISLESWSTYAVDSNGDGIIDVNDYSQVVNRALS